MGRNNTMTMPNGAAQAPSPDAVVRVDTRAPAKVYNRMIFGGFLEHFDNQIYGGVFEPGSPLSDGDGFRQDVVAALRGRKTSGSSLGIAWASTTAPGLVSTTGLRQ